MNEQEAMNTLFATLGASVLIGSVITIAILIFYFYCYWKLFVKAGYEGWKAIIPFYNIWCLCEMIFGAGYWMFIILGGFIPCIGWIVIILFEIIYGIRLAKSFGQSGGFAVGLILLPAIFIPILALGSSEYEKLPDYDIHQPFN